MPSLLASAPADELARFLARWFRALPSGHWAELKPIRKQPGANQGRVGPIHWVTSPDEAHTLTLAADAEGWDIFLGAQPRLRPAGTQQDVGERPWLYLDLDIGDVGHSKASAFANEAEAFRALARVPREPTLLVHTGGGLHAWWALSEGAKPHAWHEAEERLAALTQADAAACTPHQVLRLPGTHNYKTGTPRPVRLLQAHDTTCDLTAFLALPPPPQREEARSFGNERAGGSVPKERDLPFERAKDIPIADVLRWLGVSVSRDRCRCPCHQGKNPTSMHVGGDRSNVASCYAGCATASGPRVYTTVDLVARVREVPPRDAVNLLAAQFGFAGFRPLAKVVPFERRTDPVQKRVAGEEGSSPPQLPPPSNTPPCQRSRLQILITTHEHEVADQAIASLVTFSHEVFAHGGKLVAVVRTDDQLHGVTRAPGAPRIQTLVSARLRSLLSASAEWVRLTRQGEIPAHVPDWAVKDIEARGQWPGIRPLEGIVECPVLRPDGTVLETPGYDAATGLLYLPNGTYPSVPTSPSREEVQRACAALCEVVEDFPFDKPCHRSAWLAALLTPFARYAFRGCVPLFLIDANVRGAGKSLLTDCIAEIYGGRPMGGMTQATDDSEERKRITSLLLDGHPLLLLDNLTRPLGSDALVMVLTREEWSDRALGGNDTLRLPNLAIWYATGNNVVLRGDMSRRVVHVRLNSPEEQPEQRTTFRHKPLLTWVRHDRERLATCAVTLLRAYCAAGRPEGNLAPWGSFDTWSSLIRGALVWAGQPDPGEAREDLVQVADQETNLVRDLVAGWAEMDTSGKGLTTGEVLGKLEASPSSYEGFHSALVELLRCPPGKLPSAASLGSKLRSIRGRNVGGKCLELAYKAHGYNRWIVRTFQPAPPSAELSGASEGEETLTRIRVWP